MNKLNKLHLNKNLFEKAIAHKSFIKFDDEAKKAAVYETFVKFIAKLYKYI